MGARHVHRHLVGGISLLLLHRWPKVAVKRQEPKIVVHHGVDKVDQRVDFYRNFVRKAEIRVEDVDAGVVDHEVYADAYHNVDELERFVHDLTPHVGHSL